MTTYTVRLEGREDVAQGAIDHQLPTLAETIS
jgi:hypothetical protein